MNTDTSVDKAALAAKYGIPIEAFEITEDDRYWYDEIVKHVVFGGPPTKELYEKLHTHVIHSWEMKPIAAKVKDANQ